VERAAEGGGVASKNVLSEDFGERLAPSGLDRVLPARADDVIGVKGQADFPVGGQLISLLADSLCPCPRSADLLLI
jgi:hypothetical protein